MASTLHDTVRTTVAFLRFLAVSAAISFPAFVTGSEAQSPAPAPPRGLEVIVAGPRGEQSALLSIDCAFSEPMVRLGERGREGKKGPLRFDPPLRGTFTWLGTSTVSFMPDEPPPPGTLLTCTVPAGLKSIAGKALPTEYSWTIEYRRPRLLASIPGVPRPQEPKVSVVPLSPSLFPDDPLLLSFSAPLRPGEADRIRLSGPDGPVSVRAAAPDSALVHALYPNDPPDDYDPAGFIVLRPLLPLGDGIVYRCEIPGDLKFAGRALGLAAPIAWTFLTTPPPGVLGVTAEGEQLAFTLATPTEPESLLAHLRLTPPGRGLHADGWNNRVSVWGGLPAGKTLQIEVTAGLPDLFGRVTATPFTTSIAMPHANSELAIYPDDGVLLPDSGQFVQIKACNVKPVRIRAAWLSSDEIAMELAVRAARSGGDDTPAPGGAPPKRREPHWIELPAWKTPSAHPDSACILEYPFDRIRPRPAGTPALLISVQATRLYPTPDERARGDLTLAQETLLRLTRLGLHSQLGDMAGLFWITDLLTGEAVEDARVSFWAVRPEGPGAIWSGATDRDGIAWTPGRRALSAQGTPRLARAVSKSGEAWLDLSLPWRESKAPSTEGPNAAFVFTDRPIYRPGEMVRWKAFARRSDAAGLQASGHASLRAVLEMAGTRAPTDVVTDDEGNCDGSFRLPEDGRTGRFQITIGPPAGKEGIDVIGTAFASLEAFRAPRFEAKVETETPRVLSGGTGVFTGRFGYFSGGPLAGMPLRWFVSRQPWWFHPHGWEGYSFGDDRPGNRFDAQWAGPQSTQSGETRLDLDGRVRMELPLVLPPESGDALLTVEMGARDLADQSAFDRTQVELVRGPWRPAVRAAWDEELPRGQGAWNWAVTDTAGKAVSGVNATLEFIRREWRTVRVRRIGGTFDYDNTAVDTVLIRNDVTSRDVPDRVTFLVPGAGQYLVRLTLHEPDGTTLSAADSRYFGGEEEASFPRERMSWIQIQAEPKTANPDDTVAVIIPTPPAGADALLVVESGPILQARHVKLKGTPRVSIPLGGVAPPSVGISATLVGPDRVPVDDHGGPRRSLPYFARGSTDVNVSTHPWEARVEVSTDRPLVQPGEEISIEIRLADGSGAPLAGEAALAIVDESVLALVADAPVEPLKALFPHRWDAIEMDDIRNELQVLPTSEKGAESPGGGGSEEGAAAWLRSRFEATAYWNPSIRIGPDGVGRVRVRLPDTLTRYRIRAIASCAGERFGSGDARVRVDRPLYVEPALPRILRPGDLWVLGAVVQNRTDQTMPVRLTCTAGGATIEGSGEWKGTVGAHSTTRTDFKLRAGAPGQVKITVTAEGQTAAGPARDGVVRTLECKMDVDRITEVAFGRAAPKASEGLRLDDPGLAGSGTLTARVAPTILAGVGDAIRYLTDFPHACTEQIDSRLLGLLARRDLADRLPPDTLSPAFIDAALAGGIAELAGRARTNDRGFRIWPDFDEGYPYLDAYTLFTLARLRQAGVTVPDDLYRQAVASAQAPLERLRAGRHGLSLPSPGEQAFLLWALTEADSTSVTDADLEAAVQSQEELGTAGHLFLLLALDGYATTHGSRPALRASAQSQTRRFLELAGSSIDRAARTASIQEESPGDFAWYSGGHDRVRPTALAVILLSRSAPDHPLLPQFANWLLEERRHGRWANTHENALALEAVRAYAGRLEQLRLPIQGRIALGLASDQGFRFDAGKLQAQQFTWTLPQLQAIRRPDPRKPELPLAIEGDGRGPIYYELRLDRFLPALSAPAVEEGMTVAREYVAAADGKRLDTLHRGESALVHLAIVVPHDARWMVLEDPLPAGCEAVNLRLRTSSQFEHLSRPGGPASGGPSTGDTRRGSSRGGPPRAVTPDDELLPGAEPGRVLRFNHRDILDDRVRFYADDVPAGIYHVYYPVSATTAGTFGTPGARAGLLYEPEVYGTSPAATVRIE